MTEALEAALEGLKLLGVSFPKTEEEQEREFLADIKCFTERVNLSNVRDLVNLPECTDTVQLMTFKLYVIIFITTCELVGFNRAADYLRGGSRHILLEGSLLQDCLPLDQSFEHLTMGRVGPLASFLQQWP